MSDKNQDIVNNPFANLFKNPNEIQTTSASSKNDEQITKLNENSDLKVSNLDENQKSDDEKINKLLETIFRITLKFYDETEIENRSMLIFLGDLFEENEKFFITNENIEEVLKLNFFSI